MDNTSDPLNRCACHSFAPLHAYVRCFARIAVKLHGCVCLKNESRETHDPFHLLHNKTKGGKNNPVEHPDKLILPKQRKSSPSTTTTYSPYWAIAEN